VYLELDKPEASPLAMIEVYRAVGIFAHEDPVRASSTASRGWTRPGHTRLHGGSLPRETLPSYVRALREQDFGYRGMLLGRDVAAATA
jgi:hypothetical protein